MHEASTVPGACSNHSKTREMEVHGNTPSADIDELNDETFGSGAVDDWESTHFAVLSEDPLQHNGTKGIPPGDTIFNDDVIISAVPSNESMRYEEDAEEVVPSLSKLKIKELWPSSPKQGSTVDSIWSSPELPSAHSAGKARGSPNLPPGSKVVTVEDLERQLASTPPPLSCSPRSTPPPPHPTPPHPHPSNTPPPLMMMASPPHPHPHHLPHRMPPPPHMMPWGPRPGGPLPPPPVHLLPPHLFPMMRGPPPPGMPPPRHMPPHGHPHHLPPSHHPRGPPPPHLHPHHRYPGPFQQHQQPPPQSRKSRRSEFLNELKSDGSGFMTQKEKEWVIKIQLVQLQSSDTAAEDYYYQNYVQRRLSKDNRSSPTHDDNGSPKQLSILSLPQVSREERNYKPIEFQGTLGKLSVSSVSAPRKTIEVPIGGQESGTVGSTVFKKNQVLMTIEKIYSVVLTLEDLERRALALPEDDRHQVLTRKDALCQEIFQLMRLKNVDEPWEKGEDQLFQLMTHSRKGKRMIKRVLPILSQDHAYAVVLALLRNISSIIKRDSTDQILPDLIAGVGAVVCGMVLPLVNRCLSLLMEGSLSSDKMAQNQFVSSVLFSLVKRGREVSDSQSSGHDWWCDLTMQLSSVLQPYRDQQGSTVKILTTLLDSLPHIIS